MVNDMSETDGTGDYGEDECQDTFMPTETTMKKQFRYAEESRKVISTAIDQTKRIAELERELANAMAELEKMDDMGAVIDEAHDKENAKLRDALKRIAYGPSSHNYVTALQALEDE